MGGVIYMKEKIIAFVKKETVLVVAAILAVISAFFVHPDQAYIDYIDFRVLGILLSLMIIMAGVQNNGIFDEIGRRLLAHTKNTAQLAFVLVFLCFFSSMVITNERLMVPVIVLQTIAANLGSMLTPIGNPQNLYLYNLSEMNAGEFLVLMLPYTVVSGVLLALTIFVLSARKRKIRLTDCHFSEEKKEMNKKLTGMYAVLFLMALLVVARILPYYILLAAVAVSVFLSDRKVLGQVDYCLIFTFIAFFIFTGNIGRLPAFQEILHSLVNGRELLVGIATSQVISNVPAALLLSGFSGDLKQLLLGVNLGGLGTLIASMASLISYKIYAHNYNRTKGYYLLWFHLANIIFLAVLVLLALGMR